MMRAVSVQRCRVAAAAQAEEHVAVYQGFYEFLDEESVDESVDESVGKVWARVWV
jgi:hypothetical protein